MCNIEFPHFGASYPDAHCIDGYLWDMDSYENGCYTIGGDDPCPFCNTEAWLKTVLDNEEFASREEALAWVEKMREKWGAEHRGSSEIPNDLEEAAKAYADDINSNECLYTYTDFTDAFIAGAQWQKEQMMDEWLKDRDGCFWDGVEEGKKAMREQMMKELSEKIASAYQLGLADKEKQTVNEAEKPCHTVEEWMEHIKNADQLTKDIFSKGPYNVLYDALNHPYRDCYDAIKEFGELCYQTAREDMMKEAVEGRITQDSNTKLIVVSEPIEGFKFGDKGHIIFVKED